MRFFSRKKALAQPCVLVMAGGTGGHIFPGLAIAEALQLCGWRVYWLGGRTAGSSDQPSMESNLISQRNITFEAIDFSGLRGKGVLAAVFLPLRLLRAFWQALIIINRIQPNVVIGMGGYISFPGGVMAVLLGKPLLIHEQNAVSGLVNKILTPLADRVYTAFPEVLKNAQWSGNPLRSAFINQPNPLARFTGRLGPLKILILGGSLGATALNQKIPQALKLIPVHNRPQVIHQSGSRHLKTLQQNYADAGIQAELVDFITDVASAIAAADLIICRAGASTVTEITAVGAAALFVPFPSAVDDHQTRNADFLTTQGAGWTIAQADLTPQWLAVMLQKTERSVLLNVALQAKTLQKIEAVEIIVAACEDLAKSTWVQKTLTSKK